jgi:hypothetical protein
MIEKGFLTEEEMLYIQNSLKNDIGINESEYEKLKTLHPYAVVEENNPVIRTSRKLYSTTNYELNSFFLKRFGKKDYDLDYYRDLIYNIGDFANPHKDRNFVTQTTLILMNDKFTGGNLIIDNKDVEFNKIGMFISFDGYKLEHSVTKVESGQRRVLVIMFNKKITLI